MRHDKMPKKGKRRGARITPEIVGWMADLRKQGLTYGDIAGVLGVAFQTVARHMRAEGLGGERKVTPEVLKAMKEFRDTGMSKREIAEKLNLSYGTVFKYLKEKGVFDKLKRKMV